jgi:Glycosyl transferase family 2
MSEPDLSVVVITYRIDRQARRTLHSLARAYQRGVTGIDYEVLVVDNGSPDPLPEAALPAQDRSFRLHRIDPAPPSPAFAANLGVSMTTGANVCLILDGARMVTPGVIATGLQAVSLYPRPIVTTMAWHLGPEHQSLSIPKGYDSAVEGALLAQIGWPADGYRLFEISALAMANPGGFFGGINESCCLVVPRALWDEVGGLDERFDLPGGGLVSLDLFSRLVALPDSQLVVLLGEGSFHQVHGGASTGTGADHAAWQAQYQALRGRPYRNPEVRPAYFGAMPQPARRWLTNR